MISTEMLNEFAKNPSAFRDELIVDVDGNAHRFGDIQDDWQRADFASMDDAFLYCAGRTKRKPKRMRGWFERGRGHSKTTDLAVVVCWLLLFANRPLRGYAFAADRDQAALLKDAIANICRLNPWIAEILDVQKTVVENKAAKHPGFGGQLTIFPSDVGSSYGILPDFLIADEICHWQENADKLWHSILSSAAKRARCVLVGITNAGFLDSWQWGIREAARLSDQWVFSRLDGPQASWMTAERLEEQEKMLPPVAYERLWGNNWSTGGGDALTEGEIEAAFKPNLKPLPPPSEFAHRDVYDGNSWKFVAGLDLGVSRDCSALVALAIRRQVPWDHDVSDHGRIRLAFTRLWRPERGKKICLATVESAILALHSQYGFDDISFDPWQATHMSQRLALSGLPMREVPPTGANLQKQATHLIEAFNDRRVDLYPEPDLKRDLRKLRIEEKSYGFRLVSPRDVFGHGDLASAFAMALVSASLWAGGQSILATAMSLDDLPSFGTWRTRHESYARELNELAAGPREETLSEKLLSGEVEFRHLGD